MVKDIVTGRICFFYSVCWIYYDARLLAELAAVIQDFDELELFDVHMQI